MATRWMEQKLAKMKRDGMRETRGPCKRWDWDDTKQMPKPRTHRAPGWYAYGVDKRGSFGNVRVLPRAVGPFGGEAEARAMARKMYASDTSGVFNV